MSRQLVRRANPLTSRPARSKGRMAHLSPRDAALAEIPKVSVSVNPILWGVLGAFVLLSFATLVMWSNAANDLAYERGKSEAQAEIIEDFKEGRLASGKTSASSLDVDLPAWALQLAIAAVIVIACFAANPYLGLASVVVVGVIVAGHTGVLP